MAFTSYAKNFEDVMLWRALKHIQHGCYVDVGVQHPVIDSVSKAFYERGWRGVHIESVPEYSDLLRKDRPDETVLRVALADTEGTLELNVIADTGLSTAVEAYAQAHQEERGFERQRLDVPVLTLKSALASLIGREVHWLKIDVEGFEEQVLRGWDSQILRPWVMVVEATVPNSPETRYTSWDPILIAADYQFVYFDGLNRFYVAKEHAELAEAFSCPPNVFDGIQLSGLASWGLCHGLVASHEARVKELSVQAEQLAVELNTANEHNTRLRVHAAWLEGELDSERQRTMQRGAELQAIRVWQLRRVLIRLKRIAEPFVVWAMRQSLARARMTDYVSGVLFKYPNLRQRLRRFAIRKGLIAGHGMMLPVSLPLNPDFSPKNTIIRTCLPNLSEETRIKLPPRTVRIYADLQKAIGARKS